MRNVIGLHGIILIALLSLIPSIAQSASKMEGTYMAPMGNVTLDLKPGGKANFSMMGETYPCTYKTSKDKLILDCRPTGETVEFLINSDGSLTGPGFIGSMKKSGAAGGAPAAPGIPSVGDAPAGTAESEDTPETERMAKEAVLAEVMNHWVKGADGWITARTTGSPLAPIKFLRQFREFTITSVRQEILSESDKLNGLEWAGEVSFKKAPCREAGEPGILLDGVMGANLTRQRGKWSRWVDFQPEPVRVQKVMGEWQVNQDTWLLRGQIPGAQDFANAGVK